MVHDINKLPILLKPTEVATLLRTTTRAIYLRVQRGTLPGVVRVGSRILVERDELISWLRESRVTSPEGRR